MGKTSKPLEIWMDDDLGDTQLAKDLAAKGHTILLLGDRYFAENMDLILSRKAHYFDESMTQYIDVILKAARRRKYVNE